MSRTSIVLLTAALTVGCAGPLTGAMSFSPEYYVSGKELPAALPSCARGVQVKVTDARQAPTEAGRRFEENHPQVQYPITLEGDPVPSIHRGIDQTFVRAGGSRQAGLPLHLQVTLAALRLEERTYHNAEFSGTLGLELSLFPPEGGQACWSHAVTGKGENYGRAGNATNYQETLNRALENGMAQVFADPEFQRAVCACGGQ